MYHGCDNATRSCRALQGTLLLAKTILHDITHPWEMHRSAQRQLQGLRELLPSLPFRHEAKQQKQQQKGRAFDLPPRLGLEGQPQVRGLPWK
jgi:hypothetical protein